VIIELSPNVGFAYGTGIPITPGQAIADLASNTAWHAVTAGAAGDLRMIEVS
jgi:hypothetical protein